MKHIHSVTKPAKAEGLVAFINEILDILERLGISIDLSQYLTKE